MIWQLLRARKFEVKPEILELTSYCKFKLKEPKREKIDHVRPFLPLFTGAKKESEAVRGRRHFPKTQKCSKEKFLRYHLLINLQIKLMTIFLFTKFPAKR